ncbi:2658_t:CDS:1, partial [Ambispora gerdemannii]
LITQRLVPDATRKTVAESYLVFHMSPKSGRAVFSLTTESKTETLAPSLIFGEICPIFEVGYRSQQKWFWKKNDDILLLYRSSHYDLFLPDTNPHFTTGK